MSRTAKLGLALGLAVCMIATLALAQGTGMGGGGGKSAMGGGRMAGPERQRARQEMMRAMRAHDARLDELVAAMNAARGDAKVDAIAAVVNELVAQRRTMRSHRESMRPAQGEMGEGEAPPATP